MNFPVSRELLQNIAKEFEEAQIEKYINSIVNYIKDSIILEAYIHSSNKSNRLDINNNKKSFRVHYMNNSLKFDLPIQNRSQGENFFLPVYKDWNTYLPSIIERLQIIFPDVTFQVDPLKTYLLIDWS